MHFHGQITWNLSIHFSRVWLHPKFNDACDMKLPPKKKREIVYWTRKTLAKIVVNFWDSNRNVRISKRKIVSFQPLFFSRGHFRGGKPWWRAHGNDRNDRDRKLGESSHPVWKTYVNQLLGTIYMITQLTNYLLPCHPKKPMEKKWRFQGLKMWVITVTTPKNEGFFSRVPMVPFSLLFFFFEQTARFQGDRVKSVETHLGPSWPTKK